jgi:tetratricopeptide (TPR) repeat protein
MREVRNIVQEGVDYFHAGQLDKAEFVFDRLAAKYPNDGIIQGYLGAVYSKAGKHGGAIALLSSAATIMLSEGTKFPGMWANLGSVLKREGHNQEAEAAFIQALEYDPENVHTLANYSGMFINAGQPEKAEAIAREAIRCHEKNLTEKEPQLLVLEIEGQKSTATPEEGGDETSYKLAKHHLSLACLEQNKWPEGWELYENRKFIEGWQRPHYPIPYWTGQDTGTLLIHGEQGLGDEIMYLALVNRIRNKAKRIVVECNYRLIPLIRRSLGVECFPNIEAVQAAGIRPDHIIAMGSLPNAVKLERKDARTDGYLKPDADRVEYWRQTLKRVAGGRPIITLAWKGGLPQTHKEIRNPPRELFKLIDPNKYCLVSVQYTPMAAEQAHELGAFHYQPAIDDIDEQAAVIAASDCLVTVAQTAMHLAGGTSTPCIALIASKPRWDCIGDTDSEMPWWKSITCIRQRGQDWADVFKRLNEELEKRYATQTDRAAAAE